MASKKMSARASAWLSVATLLILLAVIGLVSEQFFHRRLDLTRDREFTLSRAAIKTLEGLPDRVTIDVVMSKDLPTQFAQIRTRAVDLLQEFEARSGGKVSLVFQDPGENEAKRQMATSMGIQEVQLQEQSSEGMQIKKGFFGLALKYGDKKEVIPVLENLETFEYDLIVKLKKLTGTEKTIGIVEGNDYSHFVFTMPGAQPKVMTGFDENFATLKTEIEKLYKTEKVNLAYPVGDNIDLILVAAPQRMLEIEKFNLDQAVMKGKSVIFLTPGVDVDLTGLKGTPVNNNYEDLLAQYGLAVTQNVILEPQHYQMVRFGNSFFPTPYPYWINVDYNNLNPESPVTSKLQAISLPWTSSVIIDTGKKDGSEVQVLAASTSNSWEETSGFFFAPRDDRQYLPIDPKSYPLVVMVTGKFKSLYASHPPRVDSSQHIDTSKIIRVESGKSSVLLIPNAVFATDFYVGYTQTPGNMLLVLNALDQLALDPDLINVRSRAVNDAPLDEARKTRAKLPITLINMILAPALMLLLGIIIGIRRRNRETA